VTNWEDNIGDDKRLRKGQNMIFNSICKAIMSPVRFNIEIAFFIMFSVKQKKAFVSMLPGRIFLRLRERN
jgi:hypothetical protein